MVTGQLVERDRLSRDDFGLLEELYPELKKAKVLQDDGTFVSKRASLLVCYSPIPACFFEDTDAILVIYVGANVSLLAAAFGYSSLKKKLADVKGNICIIEQYMQSLAS
ncbi:uncharacterized protein TERG_00731 [Trichophyton rubrum CBS 118892]|uniref:Uncharacterized protein n=1 Tax=Trichophyton rubrum (strain ATCC MYA-4607 / CBS 118892) TaxID=559305 RepID=F2SD31_TRIRC|nr:uncharacterized protein TERG_00731 [Trichophyton rubrum CBS 118892]EGD84453.2 hypothetical protein TERG_00731 [Trichophyton rubrum CBS 118892]